MFTTTSMLLVVAAINVSTDPFRLFGFPEISGFNKDKTQYGKHARMIKAHEIRMIQPKGLILGSSRAEYGLDPGHPGWDERSRPVFNLALPSGSIYESYMYLQHAHALSPLKQVVLGLDLFMFNVGEQTRPDFSIERLASHAKGNVSFGWLRDMITALFSYDALFASFSTISQQNKMDFVPYLANGERHISRNWEKIRKKGGHRKAILSNERYSLTALDGWQYFSLSGGGKSLATIDVFRSLVKFCRKQEIELKIFISPIHARKLEVKWQFGLWPTFEQWKRELVKVLEADRVSHPGQAAYELWDFSGYNGITTEPVPPLGDKHTQMRWYWEGSHYKRATGNLVLDLILRKKPAGYLRPNGFGAQVTAKNIEEHLSSISHARYEYAAIHAEDIKEIKLLVNEIRKAMANISEVSHS